MSEYFSIVIKPATGFAIRDQQLGKLFKYRYFSPMVKSNDRKVDRNGKPFVRYANEETEEWNKKLTLRWSTKLSDLNKLPKQVTTFVNKTKSFLSSPAIEQMFSEESIQATRESLVVIHSGTCTEYPHFHFICSKTGSGSSVGNDKEYRAMRKAASHVGIDIKTEKIRHLEKYMGYLQHPDLGYKFHGTTSKYLGSLWKSADKTDLTDISELLESISESEESQEDDDDGWSSFTTTPTGKRPFI